MNSPNFDFLEFQDEISRKLRMVMESGYLEPDDGMSDPLDEELATEAEATYQKI